MDIIFIVILIEKYIILFILFILLFSTNFARFTVYSKEFYTIKI